MQAEPEINPLAEKATVMTVFSGVEDHGALTISISLELESGYQSFGNLAFSSPELMIDFATDLCKVFGVENLDQLVGKKCTAHRCFREWGEKIEGLRAEDGKVFVITAWQRKHHKTYSPLVQRKMRMQQIIERAERDIAEAKATLCGLVDDYYPIEGVEL